MRADLIVLEGERGRWMTELGEWMAARRRLLGLTQDQLADRAGVNSNTVKAIEQGKVKWPTRETRLRLADALAVSHLQLLVGAGEVEPHEAGIAPASADPQADRLQALARELGPTELDTLLVFVEGLVNRNRGRGD